MKNLIKFTRFFLSLAVSLSALFTYLIATQDPNIEILMPTLGVLLLALGSSSLNQIQEKKYDQQMNRTKTRPYASNIYSFQKAITISMFLLLGATLLLYLSMDILGLYCIVFTLFVYNIIYTYLKSITHWALILGSFLGVVAPTIGWLIANNLILNSLYELKFMYIFIIYFVWQVPHFWLLVLMNEDDYKKAGFPTLKDKIGELGLMRTIATWNAISIANAIALVLISNTNNLIWIITLIASIYMLFNSYKLFTNTNPKKKFFKIKFMELNTYILLIMILLMVDNLI